MQREGRDREIGATQPVVEEAAGGRADAVGESLVDLVLSEPVAPSRIEGVVIGVLAGLDASGEPWVDFAGNAAGAPLRARATVVLGERDVGRPVALMFEAGDPARPILFGPIQHPAAATAERAGTPAASEAMVVEADGERVLVSAQEELVLRCGDASITLTRAGKILIRGAYVLTRSSGVNRIQGGSVQIN